MTTSIDELLEKIDEHKKAFYEPMIKLHTHEGLRGLVKEDDLYALPIVTSEYSSSSSLHYTHEGFQINVPKCVDPGSYCENAYYENKFYPCTVEEGVLTIKRGKKSEEILAFFPALTIDKVISAIEQGIKRFPIYQASQQIVKKGGSL